MKKIDRIYNLICYHAMLHKDEKQYEGMTTIEVAREMQIYRNEASTLLNKLTKDGKLKKNGTRPIYYAPVHFDYDSYAQKEHRHYTSNTCLDQIIGADGSLRYQIDLAKSAVSYPPIGLHTLISGESGTGKSMLAEKMWEYSCELKKDNTIPFVTFSCAEYADNPQLILEQLFGHKKGAFTGALTDRIGLVEKANNGILFLDEIHRLPPTCQELLFILMDKGTIRRIGDSENIPVSLQIIGATSENISHILLTTFRRRMPITIYMPTLAERSISEHLSLIIFFLQEEAIRIQKNIHITGKALQALLHYNGEGNIGDLKSNLLISCARSYMHMNHDLLTITIYDIPQLVYISSKEIDESYSDYIQDAVKNGLTFSPHEQHHKNSKYIINDFNLYDFSETHLPDSDIHGIVNNSHEVSDNIEKYYEKSLSDLKIAQFNKESVPDKVLEATAYIMQHAYISKGRSYDDSIQSAIMLHLKQFYYLIKSNRIIYNPELKKIHMFYEKEIQIVKEMLPELTRIFGVDIRDDEIGFLSILLSKQSIPKKTNCQRKILVVSLGSQTTNTFVDFVSTSMESNHVECLNIPFTTPAKDIFSLVKEKINRLKDTSEVLILSEVYSLFLEFSQMKKQLYPTCYLLPVVSPVLILEADRIISNTDKSMNVIVQMLKREYLTYIKTIFNEPFVHEHTSWNGKKVIVYSTNGMEDAKVIKGLLHDRLPLLHADSILLVDSKEMLLSALHDHGKAIGAIIGNTDPKIDGVAFFGHESLLYKEGIEKISLILQLHTI